MPYTDEEMHEIARDPEKLRRYYMRMVMHWRKLAHQHRQVSRRMGVTYPVQGYRDIFDKGQELMHWARIEDQMADIVGEHLDALVESTLMRG
jgi:hypothetical protein